MDFNDCSKLATLSRSMYRTGRVDDLRSLFPNLISQSTFDDETHRVRYVLVEEDARYIICFRGSVIRHEGRLTHRSWHLNFKVRKETIPFGINSRIHSGYLREADRALQRLKPRLRRRKKIVACGHSQGGALALCLALHVHRFYQKGDLEVVTFGQPKVANQGFCRFLDRHGYWRVDRFVNVGDGVAKLPLEFMGYFHCDAPIYLRGDGVYSSVARYPLSAFTTVSRHSVREYARRIEEINT